ncbi:MAG: calcium/sodium antiporter [Geminicoccaceae bacterium]
MVLSLLVGLVLLLGGGEILVRGAVTTAERLGISPLVIGVTLVGFGTSAPELVTSIDAALKDAPGIAIGNVIGSNIANVLLILAIGALLSPFACSPEAFKRDGPVIALSAIACSIVVLSGHIGRLVGSILVLLLIAYLIWVAMTDHQQQETDSSTLTPVNRPPLIVYITMALLGLVGIICGADLLVEGAIELAGRLGVSEALIGLTVVAIGTSLPELATTVVAAIKRQGDIAFGNIIGSCIFNSLGILGTTAIVTPITVPTDVAAFDIWVMLGATAALILFAVTSWRINRLEGGILLSGYAGYLGVVSMAL